MKILFITSNRLGDAVLSTGLLDYIAQAYPEAKVTIACGGLPATLFEGYPLRERVIVLQKQSFHRHWLDLWRQTVGTKWDMVVDLRDSAVSRFVRAKKRYIYSAHIDKKKHKVEQCAAVMKLDTVLSPRLWPTEEQKAKAVAFIPDGGAVLGIGPTANWIGKTWPADRFIEAIKVITAEDGILPNARVAVFAAPGEEDDAYTVLSSVPEERQIDMIAKADPGTAAATVQRCDLYIGNDSGMMHCAAAAGVKTIGLFGPSWPYLYAPWGKHTKYVSTPETFAELTDFEGYDPKALDRTLMLSLSLEDVLNAL